MKVRIEDILITERIRKEIKGIDELVCDIRRNGLINPITVMKDEKDEIYRLIAGLRRIKAAQALGWKDIEVYVVAPADAEAAILIEISENEQREPFTFTEKMDIARIIEEIERAKAKERMLAGVKTTNADPVDPGPQGQHGKSRDAVGDRIGMSGRQYGRAKFVAENAPPELIQQLDNGDKTIKKAYAELRDKAVKTDKMPGDKPKVQKTTETEPPSKPDDAPSVPEIPQSKDPAPKAVPETPAERPLTPYMQRIMEQDEERLRKNREWNAMSPEEKISALEKRVDEESLRANRAENELMQFKEQIHNQIYHRDSIIDNLKNHNDRLASELEAANARIASLEGRLRDAGLPCD